MFNKKSPSKNGSMSKNTTSGSQPMLNMISEETELKGNLRTKNDIRVAGKVHGELKANGKCIISQTGLITGDLSANEADVAGTIEGEITIGNKLILRASAVVKGDINTKVILIEEGATFDGVCKMSSSPLSGNPDKLKEKSSILNKG